MEIDINRNINLYLYGNGITGGVKPQERYASFDYCYNYFQSYREDKSLDTLLQGDNLQISCLQISFYLASWGMLRNSFLLGKSIKYYESLIEGIVDCPSEMWNIDADKYTDENIDILIDCYNTIWERIGKDGSATVTLVTKIMLGVFGNVPAFDDSFKKTFRMYTFGGKSLRRIGQFYIDNKDILDSYKIATIDYKTGEPTHRYYTKAKLIDMVGFIGHPSVDAGR